VDLKKYVAIKIGLKDMYKTRNLPNTRIDVADALRGIAVAGIILYHSVEHFNIFT
jgi:uncharacterized protein